MSGLVETTRLRPMSRLLPHLLAITAGLVAWAALFWPEINAAVGVWYDSTAYSHCYMVLPIAAYLAWDRRDTLGGVPIRPAPGALTLALPLALAWFAAERLGIMELRQFAAVGVALLLILAVIGWRMTWALSAPLLYLVFLVPFGAFLTPWLQDATLWLTMRFLDFSGVPAVSDGYTIEVPHATFFVAEACAGLRFLIASVAFGALYACLIYRTPGRRIGFMLASVAIPIVANGLRAFGIVYLGYVLGSAQAAAADHLVYGWVFFSIVILLLILAGLPFRQDRRAVARSSTPRVVDGWRPWVPAAFVMLLSAAGPVAAMVLDQGALAGFAPPVPRLAVRGCTVGPSPSAIPPGGVGTVVSLDCGAAGPFTLLIELFPARSNPVSLQGAVHGATGEADAFDATTSVLHVPGGTPPAWRLVETSEPARVTAVATWIDGRPAQGGLIGRIVQARDSLFGASHAPVLVALARDAAKARLSPAELRAIVDSMSVVLTAQTGWADAIEGMSAEAGR